MRSVFISILLVVGIAVTLAGCGSKNPTTPKIVLQAPVLESINGATQPSGPTGSTVILEGAHFGSIQGTSAVLFTAGAGAVVAATIASGTDWTDTYIVTTVPSSATTGPVRVVTPADTSNSITFTVTQASAFSPSTISWTATTPLPLGLSGLAAAYATVRETDTTNVVYVVGGADTTDSPQDEALYSVVQSDGHLGPWIPTTPLPVPLAFHAMAVATPSNSRIGGAGMLYVVGGETDTSGTTTSLVSRAALNDGGPIGAWMSTRPLPMPLHSEGAVVYRGELYVVGGATSGNAPTAAVYSARIDSDGTLESWQPQSSLPFARAYHEIAAFGGYLYAFGGDSSAVAPNDANVTNNTSKLDEVAVARIDLPTRDLQPWGANVVRLIKGVSKHTAAVAGGYVLISGGLYNGAATGSSEESYAQFLSDGSIGSFSGATGSHTINSAGGGNLFNHAAVSYIDATGAAHVLVIGGDDVNSPGKKHRDAWFN